MYIPTKKYLKMNKVNKKRNACGLPSVYPGVVYRNDSEYYSKHLNETQTGWNWEPSK